MRLIDCLVGHLFVARLGDLLRQGDVGQVDELEARQDFEGDVEGQVVLGLERPVDDGSLTGEFDLGLEG